MSFLSGKASWRMAKISGKAPESAQAVLDGLNEYRFRTSTVIDASMPDIGFTAGGDLEDYEFLPEKCVYGDMVHFGLRIDSHKVPGPIKKAIVARYLRQAKKASSTGYLSRAEVRETKIEANKEIAAQIQTGRYRKSKMPCVVWDLKEGMLYCNAGGSDLESLIRAMQALGARLHFVSAGYIAEEFLREQGMAEMVDRLRPSKFTPAPTGYQHTIEGDGPCIPWAMSGHTLDFLGNEFLYWAAVRSATADNAVKTLDGAFASCAVESEISMSCAFGLMGQADFNHPDGAVLGLPEVRQSFHQGKWPRKASMLVGTERHGFELTLQSDQWAISGATIPEDKDDHESQRQRDWKHLDGVMTLSKLMQELFHVFLLERVSSDWTQEVKQMGEVFNGR